jgi:asparaginyl-tRNA synthetase
LPKLCDTLYDVIYSRRPDLPFYLKVAEQYPGPILEAACGTGRILIPLARQGHEIVGFDLSAERLDICTKRLAKEKEDIRLHTELYHADMTKLDLGRSFGLIITPFRGLQDVLDPRDLRRAFERFRQHLLPEGRLIIDVFNPSIPFLAGSTPTGEFDEVHEILKDGRCVRLSYRILGRDLFAQTQKIEEIISVEEPDGKKIRESRIFETRYAFRWELEYLLELTGFEIEKIYGGYDFSRLGDIYPGELLMVTRRNKKYMNINADILKPEVRPQSLKIGGKHQRIDPPGTWLNSNHWLQLIDHPWYKGLVKIQDRLHYAIHDFFRNEGLRILDLPLTTGSISSPMGLGSDSMPVKVDICGCRTYLADSMQFLLELGCRLHPEGVFYKSVSFRGEETDKLHLAQFHHAECEIPGNLDDIMIVAGHFVHYLTMVLLEDCAETVERMAGNLTHLETCAELNGRFPSITNSEAVDILASDGQHLIDVSPIGFKIPSKDGEKRLVEFLGAGIGVWLTHLPSMAVPFYQALDPLDSECTLTADFILGKCETLGSGQRHKTEKSVRQSLARMKVEPEPYEWYCKMRQEKALGTSGFGLGIERYLMWALNQDDIRNCVILLRSNGHPTNP